MRMAPVRQLAILAPLLFFLFGRNSLAGVIADDDDPEFGNRDVCDPDQELVLASFGGCGCCVRTSSYKDSEDFMRNPAKSITQCPNSIRKNFRSACCDQETEYRDGPCHFPDLRLHKRLFDMPEHYGFVGGSQQGKVRAHVNVTTIRFAKRSSCPIVNCFKIEQLEDRPRGRSLWEEQRRNLPIKSGNKLVMET